MLLISHPTGRIKCRIHVPSSKSESNRVLILNALAGNKLKIENLSTARDTQKLVNILSSTGKTINVLDAGTSMRFLVPYYCALNENKIITGTGRMKQRPVLQLVNALHELGFDVRYLDKEGFPPVEVVPVSLSKVKSEVAIAGNISSQFITGLLLIAPFLPAGLKINITTPLVSRPYIEMTLGILKYFSVNYVWKDDCIEVKNSMFEIQNYFVGGDWSSASYWYAIAFLSDEAEIFLEGLKDDWCQGDRVVVDWMKRFGVITKFEDGGVLIKKTDSNYPRMMKMNFTDNPDLAQTFAVMFAAKNIYSTFSGIESLRIKETDRVAASQNELRKLNVNFDYAAMFDFYQLKGEFSLPTQPIKTYDDHRMAMSFAPLALLGEITIENPEVVGKSYPEFWKGLEKAGFRISSVQ